MELVDKKNPTRADEGLTFVLRQWDCVFFGQSSEKDPHVMSKNK